MTVASTPSMQAAPPLGTVRAARDTVSVAKSRAVPIAALVLVLAVAAGLRLTGLDREGYWGDEYAQTQLYGLSLHHTCYFAAVRHAFGPPDFIIGWLAHRSSPTVWMCRLPSAIWGVVAIAACFCLGRRLFSWREGAVAAALLTLCPLHLLISQEARPYSICLAFMLVTLVLLLRAFERPTWRRVALFGVVAFTTVMTRSFTPAVLLLVIGVVMTVTLLRTRRHKYRDVAATPIDPSREEVGLKRIWIATLAAGLLAMPAVAFMYITCYAGDGVNSKLGLNNYGIDPRYMPKVARYAGSAATTLLENYGPIVAMLACAGVAFTFAKWRKLTSDRRIVLAVMLLVGPAVIAIYAVVGGTHLYYSRYCFYLMPICAIFAATALVSIMKTLSSRLSLSRPVGRAALCLGIVTLFAYPAALSAGFKETRHRRDWRGCAAQLGELVTPDDVVMVLTDAPFGRVQHRFFGKYEWAKERRPLGEAMWTLASSDAHFERLINQTGRCYTVIAYDVAAQMPDGYESRGLSEPPPGYQLVKFRGLDLLIPDERSDLRTEVVAACDALLPISHADPSTNVISLILKARLLRRVGMGGQATAAYRQALHMVPPLHRDYFDHATSWIADADDMP